MTISLEQVKEGIQIINAAGLLGMLVFIVWSGFKGRWVYGWIYRDMKADRDLRANVNERAIVVADQALRMLADKEDHR